MYCFLCLDDNEYDDEDDEEEEEEDDEDDEEECKDIYYRAQKVKEMSHFIFLNSLLPKLKFNN
jgi:hypothetical protein